MTQPKVPGIGIAVAVLLALLEIYAAYRGVRLAGYIVGGRSNVSVSDCLSAASLVLAIVVLVGVAMIFARRQSAGRILLWGAPVQLLCALVGVILSHTWWESVAFAVMTVLAVVLWLPAVSAKTPPPMGYGMPYGTPVPGMPQYPGQQYPQQYGAAGMPQPYPPQQPCPQQPMPGRWPASGPPRQGWPGR
ncbi:hypothetical protein [Amycolatopsis rubida]|uniref:Uncharacterized protein n=1 Tax=Amycolatopsis rubida TaxID=112413 RepID=A0A1I6BK24_9PSEU|nr:hypothetical protein [Amycolatopsis rubida]SFQ81286.1 hypothetical protein SAMN05421854_12938 [Amycolatopsis rubida]